MENVWAQFGVVVVKTGQPTFKKVYCCYENSPPWIISSEVKASVYNTVM